MPGTLSTDSNVRPPLAAGRVRLGTARRRPNGASSALILHDAVVEGADADQQDTLVQVRTVARALSALGYRVTVQSLDLDLTAFDKLAARPPSLVFNLVESLGGSGRLIHLVPSVLEDRRIAFTGCGAEAQFLTSNKPLAKRVMTAAGIATPEWGVLPRPKCEPGTRYIVKSAWEHASIGISRDSLVAGSLVGRRLRRLDPDGRGDWFAERYIEGREFNISVLDGRDGPEVLPIPEMLFVDYPPDRPRIVDYEAKWDLESFAFHNTVRCFAERPADRALKSRLAAVARQCWQAFGLRGYARIDFRVDADGRPWVLEVNANPCLSPDAGFLAAAAEAGYGPDQVVARICAAVPQGVPAATASLELR
jgi:D-alanine-D-alanine ligase